MKNFDIIGDIHGYATALTLLLKKLGYRKVKNTYRHDENRMVLFLGDYIDRGLEEESTCNIVRAMVESGDALAIQGNHEYNAICFATEHNGGYLRTHNERNIKTHENFLKEYPLGSKKHKDIISWFKTLPLFLELDDLRAVHACWHKDSINFLKNNLNSNMENYTNVKGGMTDWTYFLNKPSFTKFITYLINNHQTTHPDLFQYFFSKNINVDYVLNNLKQVIFSKVYLLKKK